MDGVVFGNESGPELRTIAGNWAERKLNEYNKVDALNRPHMKALLIELAMFELPIKDLAIAFNDSGHYFVITIKGYKQILVDSHWCNTFLASATRNTMLSTIKDTFTQETEGGIIKVVHMDKISDLDTSDKNSAFGTTNNNNKTRLEDRANAVVFAEKVLNAHKNVDTHNYPYMEELLIELAMFDLTCVELEVAIYDHDDHYVIAVKGYKKLINDRLWSNMFLGTHRSEMLGNISETYTQETNAYTAKIINMDKVSFTKPREPKTVSRRYRHRE